MLIMIGYMMKKLHQEDFFKKNISTMKFTDIKDIEILKDCQKYVMQKRKWNKNIGIINSNQTIQISQQNAYLLCQYRRLPKIFTK